MSKTSSIRSFLQQSLPAGGSIAAACAPALLLLTVSGSAQTTPGPAPAGIKGSKPAQALAPADMRRYSNADIAQRPYSTLLPSPLYPSSPRVQKQFSVQYLFNYAESAYTPPVPLPRVARASANRETPEGALSAFYSAMQNGDYEAWLECWDDPSRKELEAETKKSPKGAEFWRANWRKDFPGKRFVLLDRLETVNYIIFNVRIEDSAKPATSDNDQEILVAHQGKWFVSNAFSNDGFVMNFEPGKKKEVKEFEVRPTAELVGPAALTGKAQNEFFANELRTSSVARTIE